VPDGMGGFTETLNTVHETWAAIWPVSAKETRENMRVEANVSHNIRIRYRSGITHAMIVVFGTRIFEINGLINIDERNIWLDMVCNEQL
jgi:SPP1 family predicted phage head-tail adaptor